MHQASSCPSFLRDRQRWALVLPPSTAIVHRLVISSPGAKWVSVLSSPGSSLPSPPLPSPPAWPARVRSPTAPWLAGEVTSTLCCTCCLVAGLILLSMYGTDTEIKT